MAYTEIDNPELYFQVKTYSGDSSGQAITLDGEEDMAPNLVWLKRRDASAGGKINDTVRGVNKQLVTNNTNPEGTDTNQLTAFGSNGFTVSDNTDVSTDGGTYVAWCWKETATAGFDIVTYTGNATDDTDISHSLSAVPHVIIIKNRDQGSGYNWRVYHHKNTSAPETDRLNLNDTNATHDDASYWSDEAPTSSVFTLGTDSSLNGNTEGHVAYLWTEKQGYSKFGSYTGNGDADGTFVYTGFRPAYVMIKQSSTSGEGWHIFDNKREGYNVDNDPLVANTSNAEGTSDMIDLLSNGFKSRTTSEANNESGETYIYMAFAEAPFVNSNGVPCNAR
jgi:hypothetical protein